MLKTVSSITNAIGALNYKGTWNATTNTPTITSSVGIKGDYYQVSVAGSTAINGISNWGVGDVIAFNGVVWQRIEGGADLNGVNLSVSGTTNLSGLTVSTALALDANKDVVSVTNTGTNDNVLSTSPSITTPRVITSINDTNGNELIGVTATASAVNEITVANAATGAGPTLSATGTDTNIDINITPKGTGGVVFPGGAVGTPAITTSSDLNTGIYFPAADVIALTAGGAEVARNSGTDLLIGTNLTSRAINSSGFQTKNAVARRTVAVKGAFAQSSSTVNIDFAYSDFSRIFNSGIGYENIIDIYAEYTDISGNQIGIVIGQCLLRGNSYPASASTSFSAVNTLKATELYQIVGTISSFSMTPSISSGNFRLAFSNVTINFYNIIVTITSCAHVN